MAKIEIPHYEDKSELFEWLVENKELHIEKKLSTLKKADSIPYSPQYANKAAININDADKIQVKAVINTTNLMDSHSDVHIKGLWKKSLRENKRILHLQEHKMDFDFLISKKVKAFTETMSFKELGFKRFKMDTEALIFDSEVAKAVNEKMFGRYAKGEVDNHSVGMRYVKLDLAINDPDFPSEFEVWEKFIDQVANKKDAEAQGFFWPVTEAKVIEGSAVLAGSNFVTPTLSAEAKDIEPGNPTQSEPSTDTRKRSIYY